MPLISKTELKKQLNVAHSYISMAIKRGNLIEVGNKIDTDNPVNSYFIQKRLGKLAPEASEEGQIKAADKLTDLRVISEKIKIKKTNEEYELIKMKKEKLQGSVIPVDVIKSLIINVSESVKLAWTDAAEDMLLQLSARHKLSRSETAELKTMLVKVVNKAVDDSVEDSKKRLRRIQNEYSESKGKGERN